MVLGTLAPPAVPGVLSLRRSWLPKTGQPLTSPIIDMVMTRRGEEAQKNYEPDVVDFAVKSGIAPHDIDVFRKFSEQEELLIVVRNPKSTSWIWHGMFRPKPIATKAKSGDAGLAITGDGRLVVSDYDLMCIWRQDGDSLKKIFVSAQKGQPRGGWTQEARDVIRKLNRANDNEGLISRIQHGCQDDFLSSKNPGLNRKKDHFSVFENGQMHYISSPDALADFYDYHQMPWPYAEDGHYQGKCKDLSFIGRAMRLVLSA